MVGVSRPDHPPLPKPPPQTLAQPPNGRNGRIATFGRTAERCQEAGVQGLSRKARSPPGAGLDQSRQQNVAMGGEQPFANATSPSCPALMFLAKPGRRGPLTGAPSLMGGAEPSALLQVLLLGSKLASMTSLMTSLVSTRIGT
jgi:hypothetical protein